MKYQKYLDEAQRIGIESYELYIEHSYRLSIEVFHQEIVNYTIADSSIMAARGIYDGKMGYAYSELNDRTTPLYLAEQVKENAKSISTNEVPVIFKGSSVYHKKQTYDTSLDQVTSDQKIALLKEIETKLRAQDERIVEVGAAKYEERKNELTIVNSHGLMLKHKSNYFFVYAEAVAKADEQVKTGYEIYFGNHFADFHIDEFVAKIAQKTLRKLGSEPCESRNYPCVFAPNVTASLLSCYLDSASAEEVQRHSSFLEGKLSQPVASKKVTLLEMPLTKNIHFRYFDDEGVATYNKPIVEKGILKTYLYNTNTAQKDGVSSTGNGYRSSAKGKIGTRYNNVFLKPGKHSEAEVIATINEGVYIEDVQGLHSGTNRQSGNFSLQAAGYMIRNGVLAEPIHLITIAGNLLAVMEQVKEVANNVETHLNSISCPSILVKEIAVSGK